VSGFIPVGQRISPKKKGCCASQWGQATSSQRSILGLLYQSFYLAVKRLSELVFVDRVMATSMTVWAKSDCVPCAVSTAINKMFHMVDFKKRLILLVQKRSRLTTSFTNILSAS
jgi:hypothetical protein